MTDLMLRAELDRLVELEATVDGGLKTFVDVGNALLEIRDTRLYRANYGTFEDYCRTRWGFTARRAGQLIEAAAIGTIVPIHNEGQARELARVHEDDRADVWERTLAETNGKPTAAAIRQAAEPAPKPRRADPVWSTEEYYLLEQIRDGRTVVVSMRGQHENLIAWAEAEGKYQRIDRRSEWGNPFEMPGDGDRAAVIDSYARHYLPHKPSLLSKLDDLRGKVLGCWCSPEPCHGDVLVKEAEA